MGSRRTQLTFLGSRAEDPTPVSSRAHNAGFVLVVIWEISGEGVGCFEEFFSSCRRLLHVPRRFSLISHPPLLVDGLARIRPPLT